VQPALAVLDAGDGAAEVEIELDVPAGTTGVADLLDAVDLADPGVGPAAAVDLVHRPRIEETHVGRHEALDDLATQLARHPGGDRRQDQGER